MDEVRGLIDANGIRLVDALNEHGIDLEQVKASEGELENAGAYLELHIEQGPVLLDRKLPLGSMLSTYGVERHTISHGQAAHSGSTPMDCRKDALLAAARMSPEIYAIAERHGGVCTIGFLRDQAGDSDKRSRRLSNHPRSAAFRGIIARRNACRGETC